LSKRQQHDRHVAVTARQTFQVIGQLHQAAHQRGICVLAIAHVVFEQRDGECFHLFGHHRGAVQLNHAQGALHLMQVVGARTHNVAVAGVVNVGFQ
jgi:hypothetical protein